MPSPKNPSAVHRTRVLAGIRCAECGVQPEMLRRRARVVNSRKILEFVCSVGGCSGRAILDTDALERVVIDLASRYPDNVKVGDSSKPKRPMRGRGRPPFFPSVLVFAGLHEMAREELGARASGADIRRWLEVHLGRPVPKATFYDYERRAWEAGLLPPPFGD